MIDIQLHWNGCLPRDLIAFYQYVILGYCNDLLQIHNTVLLNPPPPPQKNFSKTKEIYLQQLMAFNK